MSELKPCAYLHILDNTEGIETNTPEKRLTFQPTNAFGTPGINYDNSFQVTTIPLYTRQSPKKMIAEGLGSMRRRGYFDGGLIIQDVAKRANLEIEEVQKFMTILLESCKEDN